MIRSNEPEVLRKTNDPHIRLTPGPDGVGSMFYLWSNVGALPDDMHGSDYPFSLGDMPGILARVGKLSPRGRDAVRGENAKELFGLRI